MLAQTGSTELIVLDRQIEAQRARVALAAGASRPGRDADRHADASTPSRNSPTAGAPALAVTLPLFTTHRGRRARRADDARPARSRSGRRRSLRINGEVTAAAVTAQAQRQLYRPLPRRDPSAGAAGRAARAGRVSARADRHRGAAAGAAGDARRPPALARCRSTNSRPRSPISSARSELPFHDV